MKEKSRYNAARKALIFWMLFIGTGAVGGSVMMLADPSGKLMGMDAMLPFFKVLPFADVLFNDFVFSGIALLIVNGLTNLTAAVLLFKKKKLGVISHGLIRQYLRNYGVIPIKGVTPFSLLFKRIFPLFSVLLFPLY